MTPPTYDELAAALRDVQGWAFVLWILLWPLAYLAWDHGQDEWCRQHKRMKSKCHDQHRP